MDRWQVRSGALVFACWLVLLVVLVTADKSPQVGDWAEPAHFFSSVYLAVAVAGLLVTRLLAPTATRLGWLTLIIMVVIVVLLELLQQVSATRTFQLQDIIDGVAGGAVGAIASAVLFHRLGGSRFFVISLVQSVAVMLVVIVLSTAESPPHCAHNPQRLTGRRQELKTSTPQTMASLPVTRCFANFAVVLPRAMANWFWTGVRWRSFA